MKWLSLRMRPALLTILVLIGYSASAYVNETRVVTETPPSIDDVSFVNENHFEVYGFVPFETQNTLFFTNRNQMLGGASSASFGNNGGFRLEYIDGNTGIRKPAAVINNQAGAVMSVDSILILNATNVFNQGEIDAPNYGLVRITGQNVDLHRGIIDFGRSSPADGYVTETNFYPAGNVFDSHWGIGTNVLNVNSLISFNGGRLTVTSPQYRVQPDGLTRMSLNNPRSWVFRQVVGGGSDPTNQIIQAVFVLNGATNINTDVTFLPGPDPNNNFKTVQVQFSGYETNVVTGQPVLKQLFLTDTLASDTNFVLLTNILTGSTYRPGTFELEWSGKAGGAVSNYAIATNLFTQYVSPTYSNGMAYSNTTVAAWYSGYRAAVQSLPPIYVNEASDSTPDQYGGRLEINADSLDLSRARLQSQSVISINAKNYKGSKGIALDSPYINYNLASASGSLHVDQLTSASLNRFASGSIRAFSTVFTNYFEAQVTNATSGNVDTVHYETAFHVLLVQSGLVNRPTPVDVTRLNLNSTNVIVEDSLSISDSLTTAANSLTVNGSLRFGSSTASTLRNFASSNAPSLTTLTNNGVFTVFGAVQLGSDKSSPLSRYQNNGTNSAYGVNIWSREIENNGQIYSAGGLLKLRGDSIKLDGVGNQVTAVAGDVYIDGSQVKLRSANITAARSLNLAASQSLADAGADFPNHATTALGFSANSLPANSSLLGTTMEVNAALNTEAVVQWPSKNLGAVSAGYSNNGAFGRLILGSSVGGLITFVGTGDNQALYVDYLEISSLISQDIASYLNVVGDYTVYFADSNLPAEQLDGLLNGHLRWINSYAGAYSGVDLALPSGRVTRVNRPLLNSTTLDSNGNGIANAYDPDPFTITPVTVTVTRGEKPAAKVSWPALAGGNYRLESSSSLAKPDWKTVTTVKNSTSKTTTLSGVEPLSADGATRFYRVTFEP